MEIILVLLFLAPAALCSYLAFREYQRLRLIIDTPTTPVSMINQPGYFEARGRIETECPLVMPETGENCVYYHIKIEHYVPGSGYGRHRSRGYWSTVRNDFHYSDFWLTDSSGAIYVNSRNAEIEAPIINSQSSAKFGSKNPTRLINRLFSSFQGNRLTGERITIKALKPEQQIYVIGPVMTQDNGSLSFQQGTRPYMISYQSEAEVVKNRKYYLSGWIIMGLVSIGFSLYFINVLIQNSIN